MGYTVDTLCDTIYYLQTLYSHHKNNRLAGTKIWSVVHSKDYHPWCRQEHLLGPCYTPHRWSDSHGRTCPGPSHTSSPLWSPCSWCRSWSPPSWSWNMYLWKVLTSHKQFLNKTMNIYTLLNYAHDRYIDFLKLYENIHENIHAFIFSASLHLVCLCTMYLH